MNSYIAKVSKNFENALWSAGNVLMEQSLPNVPVDTTALYESHRVRKEHSGFQTIVVVGYGRSDFVMAGVISPYESARKGHDVKVDRFPYDYAVYVHQDPQNPSMRTLNFTHGGPFFLTNAVNTSQDLMRDVIEVEML